MPWLHLATCNLTKPLISRSEVFSHSLVSVSHEYLQPILSQEKHNNLSKWIKHDSMLKHAIFVHWKVNISDMTMFKLAVQCPIFRKPGGNFGSWQSGTNLDQFHQLVHMWIWFEILRPTFRYLQYISPCSLQHLHIRPSVTFHTFGHLAHVWTHPNSS